MLLKLLLCGNVQNKPNEKCYEEVFKQMYMFL